MQALMGKSWKKKSEVVDPKPAAYKWSSQSYTLREILASFKLPVVVHCVEDTSPVLLENYYFDLRQPLLLYSKRRVRKACAKCLKKGNGGTIKELGQTVVIPEDYDGWFKVCKGLDFTKPTSLKSVDALMLTSSEFFLCCSEFDAIVVSTGDDNGRRPSTTIRPVTEGEVLRKTGVHSINAMFLPPSMTKTKTGNRFMMCIDEKDEELLVPLTQKGIFYEVSDGEMDKQNCLIQMVDILDEIQRYPLYIRHVLGEPPLFVRTYSPFLKLSKSIEEETVMASTLRREELLPLEIQTNSPIKFELALNVTQLQSNPDFTDALGMCKENAGDYVKDIKMAVTLSPKTSPDTSFVNQSFSDDNAETSLQSAPPSQRTSIATTADSSEIGEVDANSEFSIQWDPRFEGRYHNQNSDSISSMPESHEEDVDSDTLTRSSNKRFDGIGDSAMNEENGTFDRKTNIGNGTFERKRNIENGTIERKPSDSRSLLSSYSSSESVATLTGDEYINPSFDNNTDTQAVSSVAINKPIRRLDSGSDRSDRTTFIPVPDVYRCNSINGEFPWDPERGLLYSVQDIRNVISNPVLMKNKQDLSKCGGGDAMKEGADFPWWERVSTLPLPSKKIEPSSVIVRTSVSEEQLQRLTEDSNVLVFPSEDFKVTETELTDSGDTTSEDCIYIVDDDEQTYFSSADEEERERRSTIVENPPFTNELQSAIEIDRQERTQSSFSSENQDSLKLQGNHSHEYNRYGNNGQQMKDTMTHTVSEDEVEDNGMDALSRLDEVIYLNEEIRDDDSDNANTSKTDYFNDSSEVVAKVPVTVQKLKVKEDLRAMLSDQWNDVIEVI